MLPYATQRKLNSGVSSIKHPARRQGERFSPIGLAGQDPEDGTVFLCRPAMNAKAVEMSDVDSWTGDHRLNSNGPSVAPKKQRHCATKRKTMKTLSITAGILALALGSFAQSPSSAPPNAGPSADAPADGRVSYSHIYLLSKNPEAQRHFWVDIMGATAGKIGRSLDVYTLPTMRVMVNKGDPAAGTEGSIVNHVGFRVRDIKDILAKVAAEHYTIQVVNPNKDKPNQAFLLGPDDLRIELLAGPNIATIAENHQVHFFTPDAGGMQKWYLTHLGGKGQALGKVKVVNLPGVMLLFSPTDTPVVGTKGRVLDHVGFEVKDLEDFSKSLEANGVKLDSPYRRSPQLGVAFLTDPWGTRLELVEHFPQSTGQNQKPAQQ
jgi:catechol 2,3-dioxygenase-like lactoylglutathione lyase family enzyme